MASPKLAKLKVTPEPAPDEFRTWPGAQVFRIRAVTRKPMPGLKVGTPLSIRLVPFADAGSTGARYKVWLPLPRELYRGNLLLDGKASHSRQENLDGSMTDEDFETFVTTADGKLAEEDWFAVELDEPVMVKRVLFAHGKTSPNGGWFDATAGKPRVQVKRTKDGALGNRGGDHRLSRDECKRLRRNGRRRARHLQTHQPGPGLGRPRHRQTGHRR